MLEDRNYVRFAKLAYYPYSPTTLQFNDTQVVDPGCQNDWEMIKVFSSYVPKDEINLQAKYFLNRCQTELVVSFRGTETSATKGTVYNWITNFEMNRIDCVYTNGCGGIHDGFNGYYQRIRSFHLQFLNDILCNHTTITQITFTGHSLGGALATVASLDTRYQMQVVRSMVNVTTVDAVSVKLRTFGSPRVGNKKFAIALNQYVPQSRRYVSEYGTTFDLQEDFVTGQPSTALGYYHVNQKFTVRCEDNDSFMCHRLKNYWAAMDPLSTSLTSYFNQYSEAVSDEISSGPSMLSSFSISLVVSVATLAAIVINCS